MAGTEITADMLGTDAYEGRDKKPISGYMWVIKLCSPLYVPMAFTIKSARLIP